MEFRCVICGSLFAPKAANQKVCGAECRIELNREKDRKRYAENEAYRQRQIEKSVIKFATDAEYRAREVERNRTKRQLKRLTKVREVKCKHCGGSFETHSKLRKYCSRECAIAASRAYQAAKNWIRYHTSEEWRQRCSAYAKRPDVKAKNYQRTRAYWKSLAKSDPELYRKKTEERRQKTREWMAKKIVTDPTYRAMSAKRKRCNKALRELLADSHLLLEIHNGSSVDPTVCPDRL